MFIPFLFPVLSLQVNMQPISGQWDIRRVCPIRPIWNSLVQELQQSFWNHEVTNQKAKINMLRMAEYNEMKACAIDDIDPDALELLTSKSWDKRLILMI